MVAGTILFYIGKLNNSFELVNDNTYIYVYVYSYNIDNSCALVCV